MPGRCLLALACHLGLASVFAADPTSERIITCGWNAPTLGQFARDVPRMPGAVPLTGAVLTLHADSGIPDPLATAHGRADWNGLDVERSIQAMRTAASPTMTDNYLLLKANPGDIDWFDDAGWEIIVDHYRVAADIARRAGLRGLLLDAEPYTDPHRQFQYSRQAQASQHTFAEYQVMARTRGRQVMQAIAKEFPEAQLASFFLLSYLVQDHPHRGPSPVGRGDADWCLAGHAYGLLPAFVDGWLDVIPKTMTIIDGCENGYWFQSRDDFFSHAAAVRDGGEQLVSPANRDKYRNQVEIAFPIFLDAIHPSLAGEYTLQPERSDRLALLRRNLAAAIDAGDGLVWLYGEHGRWWPEATDEALWHGKDVYPTWETQLPGISAAIAETVTAAAHNQTAGHRAVTSPIDLQSPATERSDQTTERSDQTTADGDGPTDPNDGPEAPGDGQIEATVIDSVPTWESIPAEDGTVKLDNGQVHISGADRGSAMAVLQVKPDRQYMVQIQVVQQGYGLTQVDIRWRTSDGHWADKPFEVVAFPADGDPTQPRTITAIAQSPPEPHDLVVVCTASRQRNEQDAALFGNLLVGEVDSPTETSSPPSETAPSQIP
ncbi:hypothetical protein FYK55_14455 [Roseiconus nitratireducens]|uniref:Uncharacterized protein n=1 Tax=Roseiconus nitratireducens TaxID=2605748 RepID=A0A5M6D5U7_9BACT|nr:hypothetical protein [Roseiconus nitratireducens]KAA5542723.1 hypothetical protein FYK55_14455 [Roseiconus nitratireducens]